MRHLNWRQFFLINIIALNFLGILSLHHAVYAHLKIDSPITYDHERPVVTLIDGKNKFQIVLDTGSSDLMLSADILRRYAVPTVKTQRFKDATGKQYTTPIWKLKSLKIFNLYCQNIEALVDTEFGLCASDTPYKDELKGSIGLSLFSKKILSLDFKNNRAEFLDPVDPHLDQQKWTSFNVTNNGIEFLLKIEGKTLKAIIDTGSTISFIAPDALKSHWSRKKHTIEPLQKINITDYFAPTQYDKIWQPLNAKNWEIFIFDFEPTVDLMIGMDTLRGKKIILDFVKQKFLMMDHP